ncbi:hypothetical protein BKA62DRAFT_717592 [Auriculariales sp. MPI-PUGE-AT-0066]|nr:hypothetical protein BKA62DRAFT_717592 [Auriculariales sp. MPI-PUGE-AT-0066]
MGIDWHDPVILFLSGRAYILLAHAMVGAYFWEYLITFGFDWQLLRGKRKLTFGTIIYLFPRYANLLTSFFTLRVTNSLSADVDCEAWITVLYAFAYGTIGLTSGLLYARVCALSGRNLVVTIGMGLAYLGYWGIVTYAVYHSKGHYVDVLFTCATTDAGTHRIIAIYMFLFDFLCLTLVFRFLHQMHRGGSLWNYLVKQGIVYFVSICCTYLVAVVFQLLKLNDPVAEAPGILGVFVTTVCATRMQRGLIEFIESPGARTVASGAGIVSTSNPFDQRRHAELTGDVARVEATKNVYPDAGGDVYALNKFNPYATSSRDTDERSA